MHFFLFLGYLSAVGFNALYRLLCVHSRVNCEAEIFTNYQLPIS